MDASPAAQSNPTVPVLGSIEGVAARLFLWARRAPDGLARVEFDSDFSRQQVDERVRAACADANIPWHRLDLPPFTPAALVVTWLKEQMAPLPRGVVSITGWATAFPPDVPLIDSLRVLNYNRENLAQFPLCQIWWLTRPLAGAFLREIPDLNSWFIVRLSLDENIASDFDPVNFSDDRSVSAEAQAAARRQAQDLISRLDKAIQHGENAAELLSLARAAATVLHGTELIDEATELASASLDKIIDSLRSRQPYRGFDRAAFNEPETWKAILSLPGFNTPVQVGDVAFLFDVAGDNPKAEAFYKAAAELTEQEYSTASTFTDMAWSRLAVFYCKQRRYDDAEAIYSRLISILDALPKPNPFLLVDFLSALALIYQVRRNYSYAETLLHRVLAVEEKVAGEMPAGAKKTFDDLSRLYRSLGRFAEAGMYEKRASAILAQYAVKNLR